MGQGCVCSRRSRREIAGILTLRCPWPVPVQPMAGLSFLLDDTDVLLLRLQGQPRGHAAPSLSSSQEFVMRTPF